MESNTFSIIVKDSEKLERNITPIALNVLFVGNNKRDQISSHLKIQFRAWR